MNDRCSVSALSAALPVSGTAKSESFIVAIEQAGAWPARVFESPKMDPILAEIAKRVTAAGGAPLLIRRHDRPSSAGQERTVLISGGFDSDPWLVGGQTSDLQSLLTFVETSTLPHWMKPLAPALLICTNGSRDRCCAIESRPLIEALAHRDDVWEVSHISGHRFAPTGLVLPTGQMLARITPELAAQALTAAAAGELAPQTLTPKHDRGICGSPPEQQVAKCFVREQTRYLGTLDVTTGDRGILVHADTQSWLVEVTEEDEGVSCPESCGKAALKLRSYRARLKRV